MHPAIARTARLGALLSLMIITTTFLAAHALTKSANHPVCPPPADITATTVTIPAATHTVAGWFVDTPSPTGAVLLTHGVGADGDRYLNGVAPGCQHAAGAARRSGACPHVFLSSKASTRSRCEPATTA